MSIGQPTGLPGSLTDRVAVVTGGAQGIGAATVTELLANGARVCIADLDGHKAAEIAGRHGPDRVIAVIGDLAEADQPRRVFEAALHHFGQVDVLVNNAGYFWDSPVHRMTDEQFEAMLEIHALVPFRMMREALSRWRPLAKEEALSGRVRHRKIVNVSSRAALVGLPGAANYAAGKAALLGLTKSAARESARLCINVNAVAFGAVLTRFGSALEEGTVLHTGGREVPLGLSARRLGGAPGAASGDGRFRTMSGRAATPAEAANAILFLSSSLSDMVNGEVIQING